MSARRAKAAFPPRAAAEVQGKQIGEMGARTQMHNDTQIRERMQKECVWSAGNKEMHEKDEDEE